jgi:hypothetical protein
LERPAKAISILLGLGKESMLPAATAKCHSPANNFRPALISAGEKRGDEPTDFKAYAVMAGLVPAIYVLIAARKAWMPGTQTSSRSLRKLDCCRA